MVTTENFPKLISDTKSDNQEAHRTPTKINAGKTKQNKTKINPILRYTIFKLKKIKDG